MSNEAYVLNIVAQRHESWILSLSTRSRLSIRNVLKTMNNALRIVGSSLLIFAVVSGCR